MSYPGDRDNSYRAKWYRERGLPYEPPKLVSCPPFQCVGGVRVEVPKRIPKLRSVKTFNEMAEHEYEDEMPI